ncbi:MAG: D-alanine--D-alanine ligase family protein, partial [Acidimicrobiales bacterium]
AWVAADAAVAALPEGAATLPSPDGIAGARLDPLEVVGGAGDAPVVVFPLLHGPMGEDGTVQGLLEIAGVPYVGAGVLASSLCMDKGAAKDVLAAAGLPQPRWRCLHESELSDAALAALVADLGLPVFVKPANMGSSVGVGRAADLPELVDALAAARRYDEYLVIEEALDRPREIEVAILGNADPRASRPGEVVPSHDFYDFDDKYLAGTADLRVPADLEPDQVIEAQRLALAAYRALRVDGMARVDLFHEPGGRGFLVNEVNTIPGFTPISMYPRLWQASGLSYAGLVDELVRLALQRHDRRSTFATTRTA